jgi:hypothetical protein
MRPVEWWARPHPLIVGGRQPVTRRHRARGAAICTRSSEIQPVALGLLKAEMRPECQGCTARSSAVVACLPRNALSRSRPQPTRQHARALRHAAAQNRRSRHRAQGVRHRKAADGDLGWGQLAQRSVITVMAPVNIDGAVPYALILSPEPAALGRVLQTRWSRCCLERTSPRRPGTGLRPTHIRAEIRLRA